jgi:hypothetical protein
VRRRLFIAGGLTACFSRSYHLFAQEVATKLPRIGILSPASNDRTPIFVAFHDALRQLGYVEGRTVHLEFRFAN